MSTCTEADCRKCGKPVGIASEMLHFPWCDDCIVEMETHIERGVE